MRVKILGFFLLIYAAFVGTVLLGGISFSTANRDANAYEVSKPGAHATTLTQSADPYSQPGSRAMASDVNLDPNKKMEGDIVGLDPVHNPTPLKGFPLANFSDLRKVAQALPEKSPILVDIQKQDPEWIQLFVIGLVQGFPVTAFFFFLGAFWRPQPTEYSKKRFSKTEQNIDLGIVSVRTTWNSNSETLRTNRKIKFFGLYSSESVSEMKVEGPKKAG